MDGFGLFPENGTIEQAFERATGKEKQDEQDS